ncbi:MAG: hypothetical protein JSR82_15465 [Verrucomicrobia bacterium]|nr:hypothetical protein [Verrucomicrobiota bacterium]
MKAPASLPAPIQLPRAARVLLGLRIALSAAFIAWLFGLMVIALWSFVVGAGAGRSQLQEAAVAVGAVALYSLIGVLPCALLLAWPACVFALRAQAFPLWLGALTGLGCGALVALGLTGPQLFWTGICAAYGGVLGGAAAYLGQRWIPRASSAPSETQPNNSLPPKPL